jgi:hypothetical protein
VDGLPDRRAAAAGHVDVRGPAPAVDDREHLVRGEVAERRDRYGHAQDDAGQHVVRMVDGQVKPGQAEDGNQRHHHGLGHRPRPAGHHQAVDAGHQQERGRQHGR